MPLVVFVAVMRIRQVRMIVRQFLMCVGVAVLAAKTGFMCMVVMPVIVGMTVFMRDPLVNMRVRVIL